MTRKQLSIAILLVALSFIAGAACNPTAGVPIRLSLAIERAGTAEVTTFSGWHVTLTEARIALGPLYAFAPSDETASLRTALLPIARAHGGFEPFEGREVRAQYLEQIAFDVLGETVVIADLDGLEGELEAVTILLEPPAAEHASALHGHHAWVAGTASRAGETLRFEGGLDLAAEGLARRIDGVHIGMPITESSTLTIGVDASKWLSEADFTGLAPDADGVVRFGVAMQPHRAWLLGARSAGSYTAHVTYGE